MNTGDGKSWVGTVPEGTRIPRIVHQTFPSRQLPPVIRENVDKIHSMNPEYAFRLYDDADMAAFVQDNYDARVVRCFNRINPKYGAARADLFRYLLIYKQGGVYLDIKSSLSKPLRDILRRDDRYLLSHWPACGAERTAGWAGWGVHPELQGIAGGEFQQWHVVAAPGHPFLQAVIQRVLQNLEVYDPFVHGVGMDGVLRVTGPIAYTLAIAPLLPLHAHRRVLSHRELGFEYSIFDIGNARAHKALFKNHYADLVESLVSANPFLTMTLRLFRRARRVRARCRRVVALHRRGCASSEGG